MNLCKGTYYFSVSKNSGYGAYAFQFLFTSVGESFAEEQGGSNNKINAANIISVNKKYNGLIAINDTVDIYRIDIADSKLDLYVTGNIYCVSLKLYDASGKEIWHNNYVYRNSTTEEISYQTEIQTTPGLYYFSVSENSGKGQYAFYFTNGGTVSDFASVDTVITVKVNGKAVTFDQPPVLENGRTLVPLRAIFEALGADVNWDGGTQTVMARKGGAQIQLQIGSTQMYVNDMVKTLDVPAKLINSRTLVPVRAVSEAFGCRVDWDGNTQTVSITQ